MEAFADRPSLNIIHKQNGLEALNYLKLSKAKEAALPCLIIMDINMPILTGKQLLSILKNEDDFQSIPVIIFTTSSTNGDREFCNRFNVPMITKPYDMAAFNKAVQDFIEHCTAA
jgi:CheY-like chemotaxis protein